MHIDCITLLHPFNGPLSRTTQVSRYQKGKTNLDFTEARDSEWQWHQLGHMQACTSLQTDNHASTQFFTGRMPFLPPNLQHQSTEGKWLHNTTTIEKVEIDICCFVQHVSVVLRAFWVPSVLWHCWLGGRKGIRPVKNFWVVGCWHGYLSGARCRLAHSPADATATHCLLLQ